MPADDRASVQAFYTAATLCLRVLDARLPRPRRFGPEADARWRAFRGTLGQADRLDLLVRDAAVTQPAAFAPRAVFDFGGLADDEPFGPGWSGADARHAAALLRAVNDGEPPESLDALLDAAAEAWGVVEGAVDANAFADLAPGARVAVAGGAALRALCRGERAADVLERTTVVAEAPAVRQLAGLAAAWFGVRALRLVSPAAFDGAPPADLPAASVRVASDDATEREQLALDRLPEG